MNEELEKIKLERDWWKELCLLLIGILSSKDKTTIEKVVNRFGCFVKEHTVE